MQGAATVRDAQRGVLVNVVKARGTDNTFKAMHAKLEAASKKPADGNRFENDYPCNRLLAGMRGYAKGVFSASRYVLVSQLIQIATMNA